LVKKINLNIILLLFRNNLTYIKFSLTVQLNPSPDTKVEWFQQNALIVSNKKHQINWDKNKKTMSLIINNVNEDDAGEYLCKIYRNSVEYVSTCKLNVEQQQEEQQIVKKIEKPKLVSKLNPNQEAKAGESMNLRIEIEESTEEPKIKWFHNNMELNNKERFNILNDRFCSTLNILNVQPKDSGEYTCAVKNSSGLVKSTCIVKINGKPNFIFIPYRLKR